MLPKELDGLELREHHVGHPLGVDGDLQAGRMRLQIGEILEIVFTQSPITFLQQDS
jgi:hypothetical protein